MWWLCLLWPYLQPSGNPPAGVRTGANHPVSVLAPQQKTTACTVTAKSFYWARRSPFSGPASQVAGATPQRSCSDLPQRRMLAGSMHICPKLASTAAQLSDYAE